MKKPSKKSARGKERRRSERKAVLEAFQVCLMIPSKGAQRVYLRDVSEHGLGFESDPVTEFASGEKFKFYFYANPSVRIPLSAKVVQIRVGDGSPPVIGCELTETKSKAYKTYLSFIQILDQLQEFLE